MLIQTTSHPSIENLKALSTTSSSDASRSFVDALRAQNRVALSRFYDEHVEAVSAVIWKVLGGHREHEDLVQETFCHAIQGVGRYRGDADGVRAWVIQIAVRRCYRKLRHQKLRKWLTWGATQELSELQPSTQDPHISLALKRAYTLLDTFPADERVALSLRVFMRMTIPEIVETMGRSRSTVKRLIASGQTRFWEHAREDTILVQWIDDQEEVDS